MVKPKRKVQSSSFKLHIGTRTEIESHLTRLSLIFPRLPFRPLSFHSIDFSLFLLVGRSKRFNMQRRIGGSFEFNRKYNCLFIGQRLCLSCRGSLPILPLSLSRGGQSSLFNINGRSDQLNEINLNQ